MNAVPLIHKELIKGRYLVTIEGPDPLTRNLFWVKSNAVQANLKRTRNNFVSLVKTEEEAFEVVRRFKARVGAN